MTRPFVVRDPEVIYLDGNSLGRLPAATLAAVSDVIEAQWGGELIDAWEHWIDEPLRLGDRLASTFLGAPPGTVALSDSTTVNFFKLAAAAIAARPGRDVLVTDRDNFPTDRYVLESLAESGGLHIRWLDSHPVHGPSADALRGLLDERVALVTFSHVAYRSAAIADMAAINQAVHGVGALTLWDLSHSAGAVPVELSASATDSAVGCTYKYLNGGPGSPAFLYVAPDLIERLRQPVWGWFGQRDQFAMGQGYAPVADLRRFLAGTPPIVALAATRAGIESVAAMGIERLRARSLDLTRTLIELARARLFPLGFALGSPEDDARRGGHVLLTHPEAAAISVGLREFERVIGDFRTPDGLRLAPVAAYTTEEEVVVAVDRIERLVRRGAHRDVDLDSARVT